MTEPDKPKDLDLQVRQTSNRELLVSAFCISNMWELPLGRIGECTPVLDPVTIATRSESHLERWLVCRGRTRVASLGGQFPASA